MNTPSIRIFNTETVIRMGLQNRVMRKLRQMGCKVIAMSLDNQLTISLQHPVPDELLARRGGWSLRKTFDGDVFTIDVDGCRVLWMQPASTREGSIVPMTLDLIGEAESLSRFGYSS